MKYARQTISTTALLPTVAVCSYVTAAEPRQKRLTDKYARSLFGCFTPYFVWLFHTAVCKFTLHFVRLFYTVFCPVALHRITFCKFAAQLFFTAQRACRSRRRDLPDNNCGLDKSCFPFFRFTLICLRKNTRVYGYRL